MKSYSARIISKKTWLLHLLTPLCSSALWVLTGKLNLASPLSGFVVPYYYLLLFNNCCSVFNQFLSRLPLQLRVTKAWQKRQRWGVGCGTQADQHISSTVWHSFATTFSGVEDMGTFFDEKSRYSMKCIHTLQLSKGPSADTCTRQLTFGVENMLLFSYILVSFKHRSLRPFCGAHLVLL